MPTSSPKQAAVDFLTLVAAGKVRQAFDRCIDPGFRHHNVHFPGDAASLLAAMQDNADKNPNKRFEIKMALCEGDRVAVYSHVQQKPGDRGVAVVHLFRIENGRIAELWDVGQAVPEHSANENGMF